MKEISWPQFKDNQEDLPSALYQRTEELYQIPDAAIGNDGLVELPALILRDIVVFPHMVAPIFISQGVNLAAVKAAEEDYSTLIGLMVREQGIDDPKSRDFLPIGVEVAIGRLLNLSEGSHSALIQGRHRMQIVEFTQTDPYIKVKVRPIIESVKTDRRIEALMRTTRDLFERCVRLDRSLPDEAQLFSMNIQEPGWLADMVATAITFPYDERQALLTILNPEERLKKLNWLLAQELDVLQLEDEIQTRVQSEVDRTQREFYLREQMRAIQNELGEGDIWTREIKELKEKVEKAQLPEEVQQGCTERGGAVKPDDGHVPRGKHNSQLCGLDP